MKTANIALLLFLSFGVHQTAGAATYKWVDENGVTIYSQTPPPAGNAEEAETIAPPPPPAVSPEEARRQLQQQLKPVEESEAKKAAQRKKLAEEKMDGDLRKRNCEAARHNLRIWEGNPRMKTRDPETGEYRRWTEEERQENIAESKKQIEEFCP